MDRYDVYIYQLRILYQSINVLGISIYIYHTSPAAPRVFIIFTPQ